MNKITPAGNVDDAILEMYLSLMRENIKISVMLSAKHLTFTALKHAEEAKRYANMAKAHAGKTLLKKSWRSTVGLTLEKHLKAKLAKLKQGDENG